MRHRVAPLLVVLGVTLVAACGDTAADQAEPAFDDADVAALVTVAPRTEGWAWPERRQAHPSFSREALASYEPQHAPQQKLAEAHEEAGLVRAESSTWRGDTVKGSSFATLVESADGARSGLAAARTFAHEWFADVERQPVEVVSVDGLGDGAWGVRGGSGPGVEFAEIGWRRGNAVFEVYVSCTECATDVVDAARGWAAAIDGAALARD